LYWLIGMKQDTRNEAFFKHCYSNVNLVGFTKNNNHTVSIEDRFEHNTI
jgi:hypothetical protein